MDTNDTITVTVTDKTDGQQYDITIKRPGFEELAAGYNIMLSGLLPGNVGVLNLPKAGKLLIDTLMVEPETNKMFFDKVKGPKLMFAASMEFANLVEVFDAEIKKK